MFFLYAILFLITGYSFILVLVKAIKGEVSTHYPALLFIAWAILAIFVTEYLVDL